MIAWIIMDVVLVVLCVILIIIGNDSYGYDWKGIIGVVGGMVVFIMIILTVITPLYVEKQINLFEQQSEYIQNHVPDDYIENAALTNKKIELNEWLYGAQWRKEKFGTFSFYPETIFDLRPIN
jgi:uncharacterized membrane protein